jgi:hypothetical protein
VKRFSKKAVIERYSRYVDQSPERLYYEARLAYLDGRIAFSKELSRRGRILEKHENARKEGGKL